MELSQAQTWLTETFQTWLDDKFILPKHFRNLNFVKLFSNSKLKLSQNHFCTKLSSVKDLFSINSFKKFKLLSAENISSVQTFSTNFSQTSVDEIFLVIYTFPQFKLCRLSYSG